MVQVNQKKSQLSGWGHYAEPTALFINKVPDPFMAGDTIDISATLELGGTELHFTDGTILSYHQSGNLLPALDNVTVWSVPAAGTTVSNTLKYVEIHASYTTKKGKVINAIPAKVPVATPKFMRVIVPQEPLINEGWYRHTQAAWEDHGEEDGVPLWGYNSAFFYGKASLVVYWADSQDNIIATSIAKEGNGSLLYSRPFSESYSSYEGHEIGVGNVTGSATFTRYRSIDDEGEEITLENAANKITFKYTIRGITLTAETYVQMNPIVAEGFFNLPTSYSGSSTYTVDVDKNTKVRYKDGKVLVGRYANNNRYFIPTYLRFQTIGGWWEYRNQQTITLADGRTGALWQYCRHARVDHRDVDKVSNRYYSCADGSVTWTNTQP